MFVVLMVQKRPVETISWWVLETSEKCDLRASNMKFNKKDQE
jgi:hypothetical protein